MSTSDTFEPASTQESGWLTVDIDPVLNPATDPIIDPTTGDVVSFPITASFDCFASWTPNDVQWTALQAGGDGSRIYYRVRTRDSGGLNERLSTEPANGMWTVPPAYAVITEDGLSDY